MSSQQKAKSKEQLATGSVSGHRLPLRRAIGWCAMRRRDSVLTSAERCSIIFC